MKDYAFVLLLVVLDQASKWLVSTKMALYESIEVIKGFFSITYTRNSGAAWSMLEGNRVLFIILALLAVVLIHFYVTKEKIHGAEKAAFVLIVGGAIGNVVDRITAGTVVDFLDFIIFGYDFPVFNIADSFLCIGVGLYILCTLCAMKGGSHANS